MVELEAKMAVAGRLPLEIGDVTLSELSHADATMLSTGAGRGLAEIGAALGVGLRSGDVAETADFVALPFGPDQVLLRGKNPVLSDQPHIYATDQSDGWVWLALEGRSGREVLMRLVPIDLADASFAIGAVAHTLIGHMNGLVWRRSSHSFVLLVFRSMAGNAVHELERAMKAVEARRSICV